MRYVEKGAGIWETGQMMSELYQERYEAAEQKQEEEGCGGASSASCWESRM